VPPVGKRVWREDRIILPGNAPRQWRNVFTGEVIEGNSRQGALPLAAIFSIFPIALLIPSS
jgi:maltooligosyltrehalose synthase